MPFKGVLKSGDTLKITLQNHLGSSGTAVIDVGWTAKPGQQAPSVVQDAVAPGSTDDAYDDTVPQTVTRLVVDVSVPDSGSVTLQVTVGAKTWVESFSTDTSWLFGVV